VVGGVNEQGPYQANQQPPVAGDEEAKRIGGRLPEQHLHHRDRHHEHRQDASCRQTRDQQNQIEVGGPAWSYLISNWGCSVPWAEWAHASTNYVCCGPWADERGVNRLGHPVEADDAL